MLSLSGQQGRFAQVSRADALACLAEVYYHKRQYEEQEPLLVEALALFERLYGPHDAQVARVVQSLALSLDKRERLDDAQPHYERSLSIKEQLYGDGDPRVGNDCYNLALLHYRRHDAPRAGEYFRRAQSIFARARGDDHPDVADCRLYLARLADQDDQPDQAQAHYEHVLAVYEKHWGTDHASVGDVLRELALVHWKQQNRAALELIARAVAIRQEHGRDSVGLAQVLNDEGRIRHEFGQHEPAADSYRRALKLYETHLGADAPDVGIVCWNLGLLARDMGQPAQAREWLTRALPIYSRQGEDAAASIAGIRYNLGLAHKHLGDSEAARRELAAALAAYEQLGEAYRADLAAALNELGRVEHEEGRPAEARGYYERSLTVYEALRGPQHADVAALVFNLASASCDDGRYDEAEPLARRALSIYEHLHGPQHEDVADSVLQLAGIVHHLGRLADAEALYQRCVAFYQQQEQDGTEAAVLSQPLWNLGVIFRATQRLEEAEQALRRAATIMERESGPHSVELAGVLDELGLVCCERHRPALAAEHHRRALAILRRHHGAGHAETVDTLVRLAYAESDLRRYADARASIQEALDIHRRVGTTESHSAIDARLGLVRIELRQGHYGPAGQQARETLALCRRALGNGSASTADAACLLAETYWLERRADEAEALWNEARRIYEQTSGLDSTDVADVLVDLGLMYSQLARYAEAEALLTRAHDVFRKAHGERHPQVARVLCAQADLYRLQGIYAQAVPACKRALAIYQQSRGAESEEVASTLNDLANVYASESRYADAEPIRQRCLAIAEAVLGADHPDVGIYTNNLGVLYFDQRRFDEADRVLKRALEIVRASHGDVHPDVALVVGNLGELYDKQDRFDEAIAHYRRARGIVERSFGPRHPDVGNLLVLEARCCMKQQRHDESEPLVDRALALFQRARSSPQDRYEAFRTRAELSWHRGRPDEALAALREALRLADEQRSLCSGVEHDRAEFFTRFSSSFETMLAWQHELGDAADLNEALNALDSGRARSLWDEMSLAEVDLLLELPPSQREQLRRRQRELKSRLAQLERHVALLRSQLAAAPHAGATGDPAAGAEQAAEQLATWETQLEEARANLYEFHRDVRNSSRIYRRTLQVDVAPLVLSTVRRQLLDQRGLLLSYLLGEQAGYVLAIGPREARIAALSVADDDARTLGIEPGPLTVHRLRAALLREDGSGVLQQIAAGADQPQLHDQLAALWRALVPESEQRLLAGPALDRLLIVPDGPLAMLPFEALVVRAGDDPEYLLDVGPPVAYAPSLRVLAMLADPHAERGPSAADGPVLTVGNPTYRADAALSVAASDGRGVARPGGQIRHGAGLLAPLPYSGIESNWVAEVFRQAGIEAVQLAGDEATEANLAARVAGRRIVHLACHGYADQSYGNFFGALALTSGAQAETEPHDDGFLTLGEVSDLDLAACELAILSACETNYGPQQRGEGMWSLSRGFLVGGARRIVASNWLVDDRAAANLISQFCSGIAAHDPQADVDYAAALHAAKRWVRQHPRWSTPYYWSTFVLIGPPR